MMNNTLSKVEKENPCRKVPSPDGVVAYHAALSRYRDPGSNPGRGATHPPKLSSHQLGPCSESGSETNEVHPGVSNSIQLI